MKDRARGAARLGERVIERASALFLALALLLGGAGTGYPLIGAAIELAAILLLAVVLLPRARPALHRAARWPLMLVALIVVLVAAQLVPLPPSIWSALPGRELAVRAVELAGSADIWRPLSLTPDATRRVLLALLPPVAMFVAGLYLTVAGRVLMLRIVVAAGVIGTILGAVQLASGDGAGVTVFASGHRGYPIGLFVNRNHQASFLLIAMVAACVPGVVARRGSMVPAAIVAIFALGVIATISRMGVVLLPIALVFAAVLLIGRLPRGRVAVGGVIAVVILAVVVGATTLGDRTLSRFAVAAGDSRLGFWENGWWLAKSMLPWGSGLGSFASLYGMAEPLGQVGPFYVNHAHNDPLELLIEAGWPGAIMLAALIALIVAGVARSRVPDGGGVALSRAGFGMIVILGLHSLADYPLRMAGPAVLFALGGALMVPVPVAQERPRRRVPMIAMGAGAIVAAWQVSAAGIAMHLIDGAPRQAAAVAPWLTAPAARIGNAALLAGGRDEAVAAARTVLAIQPLHVGALRTLALSGGDAGPLMDVAARMGWRDRLTQLWLVRRAFETGDMAVAAQRIDALLRQRGLGEPVMTLADRHLDSPEFRAALAQRLAERPSWRSAFLSHATQAPSGMEALLRELARGTTPPEIVEVRAFVESRWTAGDGDAAWRVWKLTRRTGTRVDDGGFETEAEGRLMTSGPFAWNAPPLLGVRVTRGLPDRAWQGMALRVASDGLRAGEAVGQVLRLSPGRYALHAVARGALGTRWIVACDGAPVPVVAQTGERRGWRVTRASFTVPARCEWQRLGLNIAASPGEAWIDSVSIARLG